MNPPNAPILTLRDYGVAFGERTILDAVSFALPRFGCTVLLGPSGTGKSVLLRTLAGFNAANPSCRTWGDVHYGDTTVADPGNRPGLVMQKSTLLVSDVFENLVTDLPDRSRLTRLEQHDRIIRLLQQYGQSPLLGRLTRKVVELSLADQRRVAILRMAMTGTPLLMIDEPTAGLDSTDAAALLDLIGDIARERAVLVVLHNLREARQVANHVMLLASGHIEEAAGSDTFFSAPRSTAAQAFLRTGSCPEAPRAESALPVATAFRFSQVIDAPSAARGPAGFRWLLPGRLGGVARPGIIHDIRYDLDALRAVGVTHLISLAEEPIQPALATEFGIRWTTDAMPDMHPPSLQQAIGLCQRVDGLLAANEVVTVHCHAGLGRTGTVLAAFHLWHGRGTSTAAQALEHVRRIEHRWVQSPAQVEFLEAFALVVADMANSAASPSLQPGFIGRIHPKATLNKSTVEL